MTYDEKNIAIPFKRKLIGNISQMVVIPKEIQKGLDWEVGDGIEMIIKEGKHGKYLAMWCKEKQIIPNRDTDNTTDKKEE